MMPALPSSLSRPIALGLAVAALLVAGPSAALAQTPAEAEALLQRVQQTYEAANGLRATFTQQQRSPFSDDTVTFAGTLLLQGTKYRIETRQQTLVTDGDTTWIYNPATNQVIVNRYENDETIVTPDEIFTDYLDEYAVAATRAVQRDGVSLAEIDLTAEDPEAYYTAVTVRVRRADAMLTRVRLEDQNGAITIFQLDNIQLNPAFESGAFTYTPPPDAEVVDLRS